MSASKKPLLSLFLVVATELIGFGMIIPVFPQLGLKLGVSSWMLGILLAAYSAAQFIASPVLGALSDRIGRRPVLIFSKLGSMVGYLVLAFSHNYWLFLLSRLIDGFTGGNISVARAYVADVTSPETRSKGMAVIGIAFGLGFILGPALGGFLYQFGDGLMAAGLTAAALSGLALLFTILFLKEPLERTPSQHPFSNIFSAFADLKGPLIGVVLVVQGLYMMIFSGMEVTFSIFTHYRLAFNEAQNSWLFVFLGLVTLVIQGGIVRRSKWSPKSMLLLGIPLTALGFLGLGLSHSLGVLLAALAALASGMGLTSAALPSWLSTLIDSESQGAGMGIFEAISSLSRVLGPLAALPLFGWSPVGCYLVYTGVLVALFGVILSLGKRPSRA
jgi:DHA1 family tetracycline resistance protein-like MFS transporter